MECPKCKKPMTLKYKDFSYDFRLKPKKKYNRSLYWCENDDVWISVEISAKSKNQESTDYA